MAVRCFFSGVEGDQHYNAATKSGATHVLMSYLYLQKRGNDLLKKRKDENPAIKFMIDSGAHTLQANFDKPPYNAWKLADYERYVAEYAAWLKEMAPWIWAGVELDVDWNLTLAMHGNVATARAHREDGVGIVKRWQQQYFAPLEKLGLQIIYVWHEGYGLEGYEEMCKTHPYVGLPGELSSNADFNKYMSIARRYTTKLHGFAATKQMDFRDWAWASIDSITWKTSEMYGTLIDWNAHTQKLSFIDDKARRVEFKEKFIQLGFNADAIIADTDYKEVTRYALHSFAAMENFYADRFSSRRFYYDCRLPHPERFSSNQISNKFALKGWWSKLCPADAFPNHLDAPVTDLAPFLTALAAIQYRCLDYLIRQPKLLAFLKAYFPAFVDDTGVTNLDSIQKELANILTPRNPPALARTTEDHWVPNNNPPKARESLDLNYEDLVFEEEYYSKIPESILTNNEGESNEHHLPDNNQAIRRIPDSAPTTEPSGALRPDSRT